MISRYQSQVMKNLWSEENKYKTWYLIELEILKEYESINSINSPVYDKLVNEQLLFKSDMIQDIEKITKHDFIAFLTFLEKTLGRDSINIHKGCTSSDIVDTGFSITLTKAADHIMSEIDSLLLNLKELIIKHKSTLIIGRTHGMHAEPTTFGLVILGYYSEWIRNKRRFLDAIEDIRFGKISGAVGTYSFISQESEARILKGLNLKPEPISTQIIPRDRHANFFNILALMATSLERLAVNLRHMQRSELNEVREGFSDGQKGSSAMPHKRNPISSENICGLARLMRGWASASLDNVPLWHERDISHSSVERFIGEDSTSTMLYMLSRMNHILKNLEVNDREMTINLHKHGYLVFTEHLMTKLIDKGLARQNAYEIVQQVALESLESESFLELVFKNKSITNLLNQDEIMATFDYKDIQKRATEIIDSRLREGSIVWA